MFEQVEFQSWADVCAIVAFTIFTALFLYILFRVVRMPRKEVTRLSSLPLEDTEKNSINEQQEK